MKKILALNFCAFALALSGCGKDGSHETGPGGSTAPTAVGQGAPATPAAPVKNEPGSQTPNPNDPPSTGTGTGNGTGPGSGSTTNPTDPVCQSGPIGTYNGYIKRSDGSLVPLSVAMDIRKTGDSGIPLRATMKVGYLGGVTIGTETVNYDWGNNFISIVFSGSSSSSSTGSTAAPTTGGANSSSATLQIIGTLNCGSFVGGKIHGNLSGFQDIVLSKSEKSLFDDSKTEFKYALAFASNPNTKATLTVTPRVAGLNSSYVSDLPYLPSLTATVQFSGVGVTVEPYDSVQYDPLTGKLELTYLGYGIFECPVTVSDLKTPTASPTLNCTVTVGATTVNQVSAGSNPGPLVMRPPQYFKGFYSPSQSIRYVAVASLDYEDKDAKNPMASIFPNYPVLDLKISICDSGTAISRVTYETVSLNPISSKAVLRFLKTGGEDFDLDLTYGTDFRSFTAIVESAQTSPGAQDARYDFTALADQSKWRTCATP